jgi:hypothetical protein
MGGVKISEIGKRRAVCISFHGRIRNQRADMGNLIAFMMFL